MARPLRIDLPDGVYHVTSRGLEKREIARDDTDRRKWLDLLDRVAARRDWRILSWVLMDNHYHLFLRTPHADLSAGMHDLNAGYVSWFNRRHQRTGPLLQGRFKAILVESDYHYWELSRYVHLNPVRAGIVQRPERYPWGSCAACFNSRLAPGWLSWQELLGPHGASLRAAREEYARFLQEGIARRIASPLDEATAATLLGSEGFVAKMKSWLGRLTPDREVPAARALRSRVSPEAIVAAVCAEYAVAPEAVRSRRRGNEPRKVAMALCREPGGLSAMQVAAYFGVSGQLVSWADAWARRHRARDKGLDERMSRIENSLTSGSAPR